MHAPTTRRAMDLLTPCRQEVRKESSVLPLAPVISWRRDSRLSEYGWGSTCREEEEEEVSEGEGPRGGLRGAHSGRHRRHHGGAPRVVQRERLLAPGGVDEDEAQVGVRRDDRQLLHVGRDASAVSRPGALDDQGKLGADEALSVAQLAVVDDLGRVLRRATLCVRHGRNGKSSRRTWSMSMSRTRWETKGGGDGGAAEAASALRCLPPAYALCTRMGSPLDFLDQMSACGGPAWAAEGALAVVWAAYHFGAKPELAPRLAHAVLGPREYCGSGHQGEQGAGTRRASGAVEAAPRPSISGIAACAMPMPLSWGAQGRE